MRLAPTKTLFPHPTRPSMHNIKPAGQMWPAVAFELARKAQNCAQTFSFFFVKNTLSMGNTYRFGSLYILKNGPTTFCARLFLEIRTLVTWLKSTLLPRIECFDTHIFMKHNCLQTKMRQSIERVEGRAN